MKIQCPYHDCKHELEFDDEAGATYGVEPWNEVCACEKQRKLICQASILIDVQPGEEVQAEDPLAEEIPVVEASREIENWPSDFDNLDVTWDTYKAFVLFKTADHYRCMEHWVRGLYTEAAEVVAIVMKAKRNQEPINTAKLLDEIGDVGFFLANIFGFAGWEWSLGDVIFEKSDFDDPIEDLVDNLASVVNSIFHFWHSKDEHWMDPSISMFKMDLELVACAGHLILAKYNRDWQDTWERNMIKLNARYKGSFTTQEVKNRDLEVEAAVVAKLEV